MKLYCREWNNNTTPSYQRKYPPSPQDKCFVPIKLMPLYQLGGGGWAPLQVMTPKGLVSYFFFCSHPGIEPMIFLFRLALYFDVHLSDLVKEGRYWL